MSDRAVLLHWDRCHECRMQLLIDNAPRLTCETYLKLIAPPTRRQDAGAGR